MKFSIDIIIPLALWIHVGQICKVSEPFHDNFKKSIWTTILKLKNELEFYVLPEPRETIPYFDRFANRDTDTSVPIVPVGFPFTLLSPLVRF